MDNSGGSFVVVCAGWPRISDLPSHLQPIVLTVCEIYRVFVVTCGPFPNPIQRTIFRQEAFQLAWEAHEGAGDPPELSRNICQIVSIVFALLYKLPNLISYPQMDQRGPQVRGELKNIARSLVPQAFGLSGLSPAARSAKIMTLISDQSFNLHYEFVDEVRSLFMLHDSCLQYQVGWQWFRSQVYESMPCRAAHPSYVFCQTSVRRVSIHSSLHSTHIQPPGTLDCHSEFHQNHFFFSIF